MLFHLAQWLRSDFSALNVFRYPSFRILIAALTAMTITLVLFPWFIRKLRALSVGQVIREDLMEEHQKKRNTPTMGGLLILIALTISSLLWCDLTNMHVWIALLITLGYGAVGFVDDKAKLGARGSAGLSERGKLIGQFGVAGVGVALLVYGVGGFDTSLYLPFISTKNLTIALPALLYLPFAMFVIAGASNAVNFTDGLDGLAAGPIVLSAATLGLLAYASATVLSMPVSVGEQTVMANFDIAAYLRIPRLIGGAELAVFCASLAGATIGFLWYNVKPAQVFMGDVGALGIGGGLGAVAVMTKNEVLSGLILGLFVMEALSVIIQRYYFKMTKKRVFLMAPIHHHFEKSGWAETQVVVRFWIIALLFALAALASLKLR